MTHPGELNGLTGTICPTCARDLTLQVLPSSNGYYLGYWCPEHGPVSRETGYYTTRVVAAREMAGVRAGGVPYNVRVVEFA